MKHLRYILTIGLALATLPVLASPAQWEFSDSTLDNGLRVIIMEDHSAPIAAVQVWYHVGSKNERPDRQGFAHMFEHMMFRGTDRIGPEDHFKYLRRFGGKVNGYTSFDHTVYVEEVPSNQLDLAFWLEAERMANLKISEAYFEEERDVVKEEYRLRVSDPPYGTLLHEALPFVFRTHPYRWSPIGDLDQLSAATVEELRAFYDTFYVPNNATLVVVGDVTTSEMMTKVQRYFGWIPRAPDPPRVTVREPAVTAPRRLEVTEPKGPLAIVALGHRVMPAGHPDRHAVAIINQILSGGESGRIYKKLVKDLELSVMASSMAYLLEQDGIWAVGAACKLGVQPEKVEAALTAELDHLLAEGITEQELQKARNQVAAKATLGRATVAAKAHRLGYAAVAIGDVNQINCEYDDLMRLSRDDVLAAARKYLSPESRLTMVVRPRGVKERVGGFFDSVLGRDRPKGDSATDSSKTQGTGDAQAGEESNR